MTTVSYQLSAVSYQLLLTARAVQRAIARVLGVPDYDTYLRHVALVHPDRAPLSHDDFVRERLAARYASPGARCC